MAQAQNRFHMITAVLLAAGTVSMTPALAGGPGTNPLANIGPTIDPSAPPAAGSMQLE